LPRFTARTVVRPGPCRRPRGEDPASQVYVRKQGEGGSEAGLLSARSTSPRPPRSPNCSTSWPGLNADDTVHGSSSSSPSGADRRIEGDRGGRSGQGCRRLPSHERRAPLHGGDPRSCRAPRTGSSPCSTTKRWSLRESTPSSWAAATSSGSRRHPAALPPRDRDDLSLPHRRPSLRRPQRRRGGGGGG